MKKFLFNYLLFSFLCHLYGQIAVFNDDVRLITSEPDGTPAMVLDNELKQYQLENGNFVSIDLASFADPATYSIHYDNLIIADHQKIGLFHNAAWSDFTALIKPLGNLKSIKSLFLVNESNWFVLFEKYILHYDEGSIYKIKLPLKKESFFGMGVGKYNHLFVYSRDALFENVDGVWEKIFDNDEEIEKSTWAGNSYYIHTQDNFYSLTDQKLKRIMEDDLEPGFVLYDSLYVLSYDDSIRIFRDSTQIEVIPFDDDVQYITSGRNTSLLVGSDDELYKIKSDSLYSVFENWIFSALLESEKSGDFNEYKSYLKIALRDFSKDTPIGQEVLRLSARDLFWNKSFAPSLDLQSQLINLNIEDIQLKIDNFNALNETDSLIYYKILKHRRTDQIDDLVDAFYASGKITNIELQTALKNELKSSNNRSLLKLLTSYNLTFQQELSESVSDSVLLELNPEIARDHIFSLRYKILIRHWIQRQIGDYQLQISRIPVDEKFLTGFRGKLYFTSDTGLYIFPDSAFVAFDLQKEDSLRALTLDPDGQIWRLVENRKYYLIQYLKKGKWLLPGKGRYYKNNFHFIFGGKQFYVVQKKTVFGFRNGRRRKILNLPLKLMGKSYFPSQIIENKDLMIISDGKKAYHFIKNSKKWYETDGDFFLDLTIQKLDHYYLEKGNNLYQLNLNPDEQLSIDFIASCDVFANIDNQLFMLSNDSIYINPRSTRETVIGLELWQAAKKWKGLFPITSKSLFLIKMGAIGQFSFDDKLLHLVQLKTLFDNMSNGQSLSGIAREKGLDDLLPDDLILLDNAFVQIKKRDFQAAAETLTALNISANDKKWIDLSFYLNVLSGLLKEQKYIDAISWLSRLWSWFPEKKNFAWFEKIWPQVLLNGTKKEQLILIDFIHRQKEKYPEYEKYFDIILSKLKHITFVRGFDPLIQSLMDKYFKTRSHGWALPVKKAKSHS